MSRTKNSIHNVFAAVIGQGLGILISFISRIFFLKYLNSDYLGVNGLLSNVVTVLSVMELGIGPAIAFSLYKPLAEDDREKIKSLMLLYRKAYFLIGVLILIVGVIFFPFYGILFDSIPKIERLNVIYFLFIFNASLSYFFSYKRTLIICDQKRYIATLYRYGCYFVMNLLQIIELSIFRNYVLYLLIQIIFTLTENLMISFYANKNYPYLREKEIRPLENEDKNCIKKNITAMIYHKIGGVIVGGTDNIVISKILGLTAVGIYNNFYTIIYAVQLILQQFFNSVVASVGNLNAENNSNKMSDVFSKMFFIDFVLYSSASACLLCLMNPFVGVWVGVEYKVGFPVLVALVSSFYTSGMRKTAEMYREATGIFWYDRYKSLAAAVVNIIASVILAFYFGMAGVFWGTVISTMTTCFWIEPVIVYKYVLKKSAGKYFAEYFVYMMDTLFRCIIIYSVTSRLSSNGWVDICLETIICVSLNVLWIIIIWNRNRNFKYLKEFLKPIINRVIRTEKDRR